jgi:hypothetical protein
MVDIASLWLPIFLSSVLVFILSAIIHMAPLWHKNDYPRIQDEAKVMDALRPFALTPGLYVMPRAADSKDMRSPEFAEKMKKGPVVMMTVLPNGTVSMGKSLSLWFLYVLAVGVMCAYVTGRALPAGASYLHVFRFAGTTAFLSYAAAVWQGTIWYGRPWRLSLKDTFDGLLFALFTAGIFGWLWVR